MPRHIHDPDTEQRVGRVQFKFGKTELDRDAAPLFFRQAIRIDAGERADERTLAVVDVSRRGEDEPFHVHWATEHNALTTCASCRGKIVRRSSLNFPPAM